MNNENDVSDALTNEKPPVVRLVEWLRRHIFIRSGGRKGTAIEGGIRIEF